MSNHVDANDPAHTWTISTPVAGITVTALMVVSTASAIPIVGVYMPVTGGRKFKIRRAIFAQVTGTVVSPHWGVASAPAMTAANGGDAAIRHSTGASATGTHVHRAFAGATAMVGTPITFRPLGGAIAGATAPGVVSTYDENCFTDAMEFNPGTFIGLFGDTTTSAGVVRAALTVVEIP